MKNKIVKTLAFALLLFVSIATAHYLDLNDKLLFKLFHNDAHLIEKRGFIVKQKTINEIEKNLSGITYNNTTDTLFAITNSPRRIYELNKKGEVLRVIKLKGFKDTEDLTHIKDNLFAILDEGKSGFYIVHIDKNTQTIDISQSQKEFSLDLRKFKNFGLEGISYDVKNDIFYLINERFPKKVVKVQGFFTNEVAKVEMEEKLMKSNFFLSDLSAIHYDEYRDKFYILSDESRLLAKIDNEMNFKKYLDLDISKQMKKMKNPEGFTKDKDGNLFIVGEPNIFLSFIIKP